MTKKLRLDKPNQLISIIPKREINLIQQKCFNVFLRVAQKELMFNQKYKNKKVNEETRYIFEIKENTLEKKAGLNKKNYNYIKEELRKLTTISVEVTDQERDNHWRIFSLLESVTREGNEFKFSLDWMIVKALKEHSYFTKINLLEVAKLNSKYSVILYELAKRYDSDNIKIPKMKIERFREITNTKNEYNRFYNLKKRVIEKACEEISKKTDIILDYTTEKKGRKIAYIKFNMERKAKDSLTDHNKKILKLFKLLPQEEQIESNKDTLAGLLKKYEFKYIKYDIKYAKKFNPENFMGFLVESCKNGHFGKAILEKEEKKEKSIKKKKEEEKMRTKVKKERQKALEEIVATKCENLAEEKRKKLKKRYNYLIETDSSEIAFEDRADKMFAENHTFEEFVKKHFKAQEDIP